MGNTTLTGYAVEDEERRRALIAFLHRIHNLDLTAWDEAGLWDVRYRPFSTFDGPRLLSNVCVYSMDLVIDGEDVPVAQISAVGTDPDHRERGLNSALTERALAWADDRHEFSYLFADEAAIPYYMKRGFRSLAEHEARIHVPATPPRGRARQLDLSRTADLELVTRLSAMRVPVSRRLGVRNHRLRMFHALYSFPDALWSLDDLGIVVAARRDGGVLRVFDVLAPEIPPFEVLYHPLACGAAEAVEFAFEPDLLDVGTGERQALTNDGMIRGPVPFEGQPLRIPLTAQA